MSLQECVGFANENPICSVGTVDGDQPRTRIFSMWYADETGFYFHTDIEKAVGKQLLNNPKIEVCFYAPQQPPAIGETLRVSGEIEKIDDLEIRTKLLAERPFLKLMGVTGPEDPLLFVFRIAHGEAFIWGMGSNRRESEIERVKF
ncbi:pyridoxamine 5'-phosphate oxidase family protein [Thermodesulfobacteriota bacterium]